MQKKIMYSLIVLFITTTVVAQQPFYTTTTNGNRMPEKETSFSLSIIPDKAAASFRVFARNPERKKIQVQISHKVYGLLVDTSFAGELFNCRYNFDQLEDGRYEVTLIRGKEKVKKDVEINTVTNRHVVIR